MRKALLIGIDYYAGGNCLHGCVNDAVSMSQALRLNHDLTLNFQCKNLMAEIVEMEDGSEGCPAPIGQQQLSTAIDWLFEGEPDIALFYFSGHGAVADGKGYLCPSNYAGKHTGVPMSNLIEAATRSKARNKIIILDCCHSGATGVEQFSKELSGLPEDTVIMAGCTKDGYSQEKNGSGIFTQLFVEALHGAGSNIMGEVTPGSIYAYIDKSLGAFDQRPVFKANVKSFICLKRNEPLIEIRKLRLLPMLFPYPDYEFQLDPSYEEDKKNLPEGADTTQNKAHEAVFEILRDYWRNGLLTTKREKYMYQAAIHSDVCRLTAMGRHYWKMLYNQVI